MSLLKFVSFALFSLLFLGNLQAECVDLSGTYRCSNGIRVNISQSVDEQKIHTYIMENSADSIALVADGKTSIYYSRKRKIICDENRLAIYQPTMNTTEKDRIEYRLIDQETTLQVRGITGINEEVFFEMPCSRTQQ